MIFFLVALINMIIRKARRTDYEKGIGNSNRLDCTVFFDSVDNRMDIVLEA